MQKEVLIEALVCEWREAGIQEGDTLLIHSNIQRTFKRYLRLGVRISAEDILDSFLKAIGNSGTLLLPLFNFDFPRGKAFDIRNTPSHMGALTEAGRAHPLAVRTGHPIYSFAVIGAKSQYFELVNNFSGYGGDSPFAMLREMGGKIAVLNLPDASSMTYYHYVEEMHEVDYRYHKTFTGTYIDALGNKESKTYGLFVRNIQEGVLTYVEPAGELMWKSGLYSGNRPNEKSGLRVVASQQMYEFISDIIRSGAAKNILYQINGKRNG